ncbi:MAG: hypothetical protein RLZZ94_968 [Bacteroidota bacterium]|jgi:uncharacterized membrane protein YhaH (DUF805 family)
MNYYLKVLQNYANFSGRARRAEYWYFFLINTIISVVLSVMTVQGGYSMLYLLYSLGVFLPSLAVGVRRMHDVNKSGWFLLIPIYNLILACTEGTQGDNDYGSDPKEESSTEM